MNSLATDDPIKMDIKISRHAKRQMKWRKITDAEVEAVIAAPDMQEDTIKGRKNALKSFGSRLIRVTYCQEGDDVVIVTAVVKGE
jgi:hypothetical protein